MDCITKKQLIMTNKFQTYIRVKTRSLIMENFTPAEASRVFDIEYRNMCPNWNCKGECWKKYYALKDGVK